MDVAKISNSVNDWTYQSKISEKTRGYIKSRGYNLQTVEERGFTIAFNVSAL